MIQLALQLYVASFLCVAKLLSKINIATSLRNVILFDRVTLTFHLLTSYLSYIYFYLLQVKNGVRNSVS